MPLVLMWAGSRRKETGEAGLADSHSSVRFVDELCAKHLGAIAGSIIMLFSSFRYEHPLHNLLCGRSRIIVAGFLTSPKLRF